MVEEEDPNCVNIKSSLKGRRRIHTSINDHHELVTEFPQKKTFVSKQLEKILRLTQNNFWESSLGSKPVGYSTK